MKFKISTDLPNLRVVDSRVYHKNNIKEVKFFTIKLNREPVDLIQ